MTTMLPPTVTSDIRPASAPHTPTCHSSSHASFDVALSVIAVVNVPVALSRKHRCGTRWLHGKVVTWRDSVMVFVTLVFYSKHMLDVRKRALMHSAPTCVSSMLSHVKPLAASFFLPLTPLSLLFCCDTISIAQLDGAAARTSRAPP